MSPQPERRIAQLVNRFPALGLVRTAWKWSDGKRGFDRVPAFTVTVEKPDPDNLRKVPDCVLDDASFLQHVNRTFFGNRLEYVLAIGEDDSIVAATSGPDRNDWWELKSVGDVFISEEGRSGKDSHCFPKRANPDQVKCLFLVSACRWYLPHPEEKERSKPGGLFHTQVDAEVSVVVLPRRKDLSWQQLLEMVDRHEALCEAAEKVVKTSDWRVREQILQRLLAQLNKK